MFFGGMFGNLIHIDIIDLVCFEDFLLEKQADLGQYLLEIAHFANPFAASLLEIVAGEIVLLGGGEYNGEGQPVSKRLDGEGMVMLHLFDLMRELHHCTANFSGTHLLRYNINKKKLK